MQGCALETASQWLPCIQQVGLADELIRRTRSHGRSQGLDGRGVFEEIVHVRESGTAGVEDFNIVRQLQFEVRVFEALGVLVLLQGDTDQLAAAITNLHR